VPPFESMGRTQWLVYWPFVRYAGDGEPVVAEPCCVKGRWVERRRVSNLADGSVVVYDAQAAVGVEVPTGSIVWPGRMGDLPAGTGTFDELTGQLFKVEGYSEAGDLKGRSRHVRRELMLSRFRGALPAVEV
jgi:hypothetical protein